jgi:hypothetical protein
MAEATYYQGDRKPYLRVDLERGGAVLDLTAASGVTFKMYRKGEENVTPLISAAGVIVDADTGTVEYQWAALDLDLYGRFSGVFVIDWAGEDEGVPDTGYIPIRVFVTGS